VIITKTFLLWAIRIRRSTPGRGAKLKYLLDFDQEFPQVSHHHDDGELSLNTADSRCS